LRKLDQQTILITGATGGLGRALAEHLAAQGARILLHGRDGERAERARSDIAAATGSQRIEVVLADLADVRQVADLADEVQRRYEQLDVLVNNAGVGSGPQGHERRTTRDGIELRFAVNYLAGYHLTRLLVPLLTASAPSRVVTVASAGQRPVDFDDPMLTSQYSGTRAYAQSKLAQIMFTFDLADELRQHGVTANALHPATYMNTGMVHEAGVTPISTIEEGVAATARLVTDPELDDVTGCYFHGHRESRPLDQAFDQAARARLRELSDKLIEQSLS
jgi:NAD(P)-dependent dehydrogenase (short-subunit alcohol dehydrogenase family)